jgi:3-oxoacyl-[acyl-carrier-protein] synthase II
MSHGSPSLRRAVITGLGPITCIGTGKSAFWQGILAEKSGIAPLTRFKLNGLTALSAGQIDDFDPLLFVSQKSLRRLDRYAQFALSSALLALEDSGLAWSADLPDPRRGVSFGTALGGISNAEKEHEAFLRDGFNAVNPMLALQIFGGSAHANIAITCGFQGIGTTNSNSCASGTVALGEALRAIRYGIADVLLAGASEAPLSPLTYGAFAKIRTMSIAPPPRSCRPFDLHRDGFVMGEGAASLVVEEYEHAKARGARIYAEILGFSHNNDAYHMTSPRPGGVPTIRAMSEALNDAETNPEEIDYINAHGSSTQLNDSNEAHCIHAVFSAHAETLPVSATKPYTAHPLGATGAMEAIICCLALSEGFLPPTLHYETPDPACRLNILPNHGREAKPRKILSNSFGFGGINSCLILGSV